MKSPASEVHRISDAIAICQTYDSQVKADLFASAVATSAGVLLIDPFAIDAEVLSELTNNGNVAGIVVTSENHVRASIELSHQLDVPIHADVDAGLAQYCDIHAMSGEVDVLGVPGAAKGEIALLHKAAGGTLIVGDAVINFGSHGFALLPAKYCTNEKLMRESLSRLLAEEFERMLFAHGTPILQNAHQRLAALLESKS